MNSQYNNMFHCSGGGATQNIHLHINKVIITGGPSDYQVMVTLSVAQKIKALFGLGPTAKDIEAYMRLNVLQQEPQEAYRQMISAKDKA